MSIAPWQVHVCCLRADNAETKNSADNLYESFSNENIEVIYDDREVRAGVMFSDADLLGVPIRIIVSPRNLKESCVEEVVTRDKSIQKKVEFDNVISVVKELINEMMN